MKGIRFYAELDGLQKRTTRKQLREMAEQGKHVNCVALLLGREHECPNFMQEAIASVFGYANSSVCLTSVSHDYLRGCRRIDQATAFKLHPHLASYMS